MSFDNIFKKSIPVPSSKLPLTIMYLKNWILIRTNGPDALHILQNQLTCDIKNLNKNQYSFSTHCNNLGKMISNMYVFHYTRKEIAFIEPLDVYQKQVSIMKKYAIFSNITINPDNKAMLIGIAGSNSKEYLKKFFKIIPNQKNTIIHQSDITLLYFQKPIERFLLIFNNKLLLTDFLNKSQSFFASYNDYCQWIALDIEAGYPYISNKTSEMFFPQSANMTILQGINFNKGCYLGQELIARIQYRKLNKQSLYQLSGKLHSNDNVQSLMIGDHIELQINNQNWKNIGTILQYCTIQNNNIWIQAILNKSIEKNHQLMIRIPKIHNKTFIYIKINNILT